MPRETLVDSLFVRDGVATGRKSFDVQFENFFGGAGGVLVSRTSRLQPDSAGKQARYPSS